MFTPLIVRFTAALALICVPSFTRSVSTEFHDTVPRIDVNGLENDTAGVLKDQPTAGNFTSMILPTMILPVVRNAICAVVTMPGVSTAVFQ